MSSCCGSNNQGVEELTRNYKPRRECAIPSKAKEEEKNVEWVSWSNEIKDEGDRFEINATKLIFKEDPQPVFFVIDESMDPAVGISAYCTNHPESKYPNATPHGVRLANAIGRAHGMSGEVEVESLIEAVASTEITTITIEKTDKGVLWMVQIDES